MDFKYALKVAVGGAFIAALFKDSDLGNVMFPALGLLSTLQPDLASTIKSGWGRLLGSAIGGLIGGLILTAFGTGSLSEFLSLSPFLGALGFILAAITCETLQLGSAYTQAGFVAFLLTTGQAATQDPWLYTFVRVSNNWIGVAIATAIIFVFRDSDPRENLQKNLLITLQNTERAFSLIARSQNIREKAEIPQLLSQINGKATESTMLLSKAVYGILGRRLQRENWGGLIACQRNFSRYLKEMLEVSEASSIRLFQSELVQFSEQVSRQCEQIIQAVEAEKSPEIFEQLVPSVIAPDLGIPPALLSYSLPEIEQFSIFTFSLIQFNRELNYLSSLIANFHQNIVDLPVIQQSFFPIIRFKPLSFSQVRYIVVMGVAMGFALGLMRNLFTTEPLFAFLGTMGVLIPMLPVLSYGSVSLGRLFLLPPLMGSAIVIFLNSTLGTFPIILGLGLFISTLICYQLKIGFLSSAGASLIIISYFIPSDLFTVAIINILLGMLLGSLAIALFKVGDPDSKLIQSLSATFDHLGDLYFLACQTYQKGTNNQQQTAQLSQAIAGLLQKQPMLKMLSNQEIINTQLDFKQKQLWAILIPAEQALFNNITVLNAIAKAAKDQDYIGIPPELLSEFQLLFQTTISRFKEISNAIAKQTIPSQSDDLKISLESFEAKLSAFYNQQSAEHYSLEKVILFLAFCLRLKEVSYQQIQLDEQWQKL